jgi:hypothetical protein
MSLLAKLSQGIASVTSKSKLERLCQENGYSIFSRHGNSIALEFKGDAVSPHRHVIVRHPEGDPLMAFTAICRAKFTKRTLPNGMLAGLIEHNDELPLGGWAIEDDDGTISLKLKYTALAAGVDAEYFGRICTMMLMEVATIEAEMQERGVL